MRDINRIDKFCNELAEIWKTNLPDFRFFQFIEYVWTVLGDTFYMEEDEAIEKIKKIFED